MKNFLATILSIILVISIVPVSAISASAQENDGSNNSEVEYTEIYTAADLDAVRFNMSGNYILMNNIDLSETNEFKNWKPIGTDDERKIIENFSGVFDGNGYAITGINMLPTSEGTKRYFGLFGQVTGIVRNLNLKNVYTNMQLSYTYDYCYTGGIAAVNYGNIYNCSVNGSFWTTKQGGIGGIVYSNHGIIDSCANYAEVKGAWGGVAGITHTNESNGVIRNCYNVGKIEQYTYSDRDAGYTLSNKAAGIAFYNSGTIQTCYNVGEVIGYTTAAICYSNSGSIVDTYYLSGRGSSSGQTSATLLSESGMKNQLAFKGFDFDNIWTMGGDPDYEYPELQCFALSGKLGIKGNVAYLSTVEPDLSKIKRTDDTFTYEWLIDAQSVSTEKTYTFSKTDIGRKVKLKVTGTKEFNKGTLYSEEFTVTKAVQEGLAESTELKYSDDNTIEIETLSNQDYSIDKINWQKSGRFEDLDPNKGYIVYSRISENDEYLAGKPVGILNVTTDRRPITGSVNIVGATAFGDTLTADVSAVGPDAEVTYRYEWKRGDEVVGTNKTYTIVKEDIDKTLTLYVIGTEDYISALSSAPVTATKASVQVPSAPVVETKTNTTVKLVAKNGLEYSMDKTNWQDSALFEGLSAAKEYTFYQRVKETETEFASKSSNGTKATTLKNTISAPANPTVKEVTNNSIMLEQISGYEYSLDGIIWQNNNVFTGLLPNTEYSFCQRIAETETDYASATSGHITVVTLKNTVNKPVAPVIESATDSTVTLVAVSGYEYSKNGTTWQKSNVFTGLEPLETYTFYQRVAETETDYASEKSDGTSFKVKFVASKPAVPVLVEVTNEKIVVETKTGYQYSVDGVNWRKQGMFTGLNPNTTYAVCCRILETDDYYTSANSNALYVTTLKNTVNTPGAPIVSAKTDVSVTLIDTDGYEYSTNGTDWQASNVFNNLFPDTEYTFYQRVAETETDYASEKSVGTTVKTYKKCEIDPQYHIYTSDCDVSCNECGFERQVPDHIYDNACDDTCNVENCGFVRTVGDHKYDNACDKSCNICGTTRTVGEHQYDNACDESCNICDEIRMVDEHKYTNSCDTTCNECGETRSINHTYINSCDTSCDVCEATRTITHTYSNECDKTCNVCGETRTVGAHKYTNSCDTTCDYCGAERTIKHTYSNACDTSCNVCEATRSITHSYKTTTTKATLSKDGSIVKKCTVCGTVASNTAIKYAKTFKLSTTSYAYNGKTKTPSVTVKDSAGKTLKKNTDYTVTYASGRKNVGTYKVTVKMKGKYTGTKTLTFSIKPTTKTSVNLLIGATSTIGAKSNKSISYTSSKKSVATVSSKGVITAKKAGTATITVKSNGVSQKITVTVKTPYVKVSGTNSMLLKKSVTLKATTNTSAKVKWSSSNTKVATVSSSGKVTGVKAGSATIYAKITYKGKTYKCSYKVTVSNPTLKLNKSSLTIYVGDTYKLSATASSGITVKYKSSNTKVATVSSSGLITPKSEGAATITAYFTYAGKTYSKTCKVNVKKSGYRLVKDYILKNGKSNSDGNLEVGMYDNRGSNVYYYTIAYNAQKDCLVLKYWVSGSSDVEMSFELKENQRTINVTMKITLLSSTYADVTYSLNVPTYSNSSGYSYYIVTHGLLDPDDYEDVISSSNKLAFTGWELYLTSKGFSLSDLGFVDF